MFHRLTIVLLLLVLVMPVHAQDDQPRTYYESLDFSSPTAGLQTFIDAFQRYDFATVYWATSPQVQNNYARALVMLQELAQDMVSNSPEDEGLDDALSSAFQTEVHSLANDWYFFDTLMLYSAQAGTLPIDLRGEVIIGEPMPPTRDVLPYPDAVEIPLTVDGEAGYSAIMILTVANEWKVEQVIAPDAVPYEEHNLWLVPESPLPPSPNAAALEEPRTYYDTLALDTRRAAVLGFIDAYATGDFFSVYLRMAPQTQMLFTQSLRVFQVEGWLTPTADSAMLSDQYFGNTFGDPETVVYGASFYPRTYDDFMQLARQMPGWEVLTLQENIDLGDPFETERTFGDDPIAVTEIPFSVDGEAGYAFIMEQIDNGDWRVLAIMTPTGQDETDIRGLFVVPLAE